MHLMAPMIFLSSDCPFLCWELCNMDISGVVLLLDENWVSNIY